MKQLIRLYLPLVVAAFFVVSCSSDDDGVDVPVEYNANRNDTSREPALQRLEFPKVKGGNSLVIIHTTNDEYGINYSVEWDSDKKAQRWSCYQMYSKNFASNGNSRYSLWPNGDPWGYDPNVPVEDQQATYNELSKSYYPGSSGAYYEKGHICPSADRLYTRNANEQTFYMTNILPMVKNFNGGIWGSMENKIRAWCGGNSLRAWTKNIDTLYICKGGTIDRDNDIIGYTKGGHIVPRYFFMALLAKKGTTYKALAFWAEHLNEDRSNDPLGNYVINIRELERRTGIDFFCNLPDVIEEDVENTTVENIKWLWNL